MPARWLSSLDDEELHNQTILCRLDLNVPLGKSGEISDDTRIMKALPTIRRLVNTRAKVILISHLGRPKGKPKQSLSLEPVANLIRDVLDTKIIFVHDCVGDGVKKIIADAEPGSVIMLENLRFHAGEEKNDPLFAKLLAQVGTFYVNDAFGAVHRAHASVAGVTKYFPDPVGGLLLEQELQAFKQVTQDPKKPMVAIIGGAKVSSKIGVLMQLLPKLDKLIIGGAMAYTFLKSQGLSVGKSLVEEDRLNFAASLIKKAEQGNTRIILPQDHIIAREISANAECEITQDSTIPAGYMGGDIGPKTQQLYQKELENAQTIFWNGPMGVFEYDSFFAGTHKIAQVLANSGAYTLVGGGDSVAALHKANLDKKINFVSTGGGAGLELLEGKQLPGLLALGYYS